MDEDAVILPITHEIDLHFFSPREIPSVVEEYIAAAREKGFREVRLIHGKGIGVQREIVQSHLKKNPAVESFSDAPTYNGGRGATLAVLKIP